VVFFPHNRLLQLGDDKSWALPEYNDDHWDQTGSTTEIGTFWVRFHFEFDDKINLLNHKGIQMISLGSYEAYWDGVLIHKNGSIGNNKAKEIPGKFMSQILIPDSLCTIGNHILALRLSNHHSIENQSWSWNTCEIEEFGSFKERGLQLTAIMFILGGAFFIVSIYYFFLFFIKRDDYSKLTFGFMCLLFFALIVMEYSKLLYAYPYTFHATRLIIIGWLTASIALVVPLFLIFYFDLPRKKVFTGIIALIILLVILTNKIRFDSTTILLSSLTLLFSIVISSIAVYLKRKRGVLILLAFIVVMSINYFSKFNTGFMGYSYDINLFVSFLIVVLAFLYALSQQRKEQLLAYEASLLHSERLKNELLRKNIRPHFIMNTLTSIMEWVERSPKKSIEFIDALAGEFDLLNGMADDKLIPIVQEIELCKKHLEIMTFRKEISYEWEDHNVNLNRKIPPAVFHTIIENGITHSATPAHGIIKFILNETNSTNSITYSIEVQAPGRKQKQGAVEGTGYKYIKSRLSESYGKQWALRSKPIPNGWQTEIEIFHNNSNVISQ